MTRLYGPGPGEPPTLIWTRDLEGLSARDVEDRPVGRLFGALSEERTGLIRYIDVALATAPRHVLVPIGHARVAREATPPSIRLRAATYEDLLEVPEHEPESSVSDPAEHARILEAHGRLYYGARYYAHPAFDHEAVYAGESPIVAPETGEGPGAPAEAGLRPLAGLRGYRVARREDDVRGWPVEDEAGERLGEVEDLLVELAAGQARYAVVRLEEPDRATAIPMGYLHADREAGRLTVPGLDGDDLRVLPPYEPPLDRGQENRIRAALEARLTGQRYYRRPDFRTGDVAALG